MSDAETLIAELVTAVASKDVTAITMTAVALGRLLQRLELGDQGYLDVAGEDPPPDGVRRPRRVDGPPPSTTRTTRTHVPGRAVSQTQPGPNYRIDGSTKTSPIEVS